MAKATIIITDTEDNSVNLTLDFDPPVTNETRASHAQHLAVDLVRLAGKIAAFELERDLDEEG